MIKRLLYSVVLAVLVVLLTTMSVLAIADPLTDPQVKAVYVYEDLAEDGDLGILIDYYLDYDLDPLVDPDFVDIPDEFVTEAYLASFIDIDGTTQLGTVAPYTFESSGYGRGMIWIYFTAAEADDLSIDSVDELLYSVWFMGNPTVPSGWTGDPPKTTAAIDEWWATGEGDSSVLLALRVLYFADVLELFWELPMITETALGSRLTPTGESYFENVIPNLRTIAPACFSVSTVPQVQEDLDYSTAFGATIANGTGTLVAASPLDLPIEGAPGNNVVIATTGTFILELEKGTVGTAASIDATVDDTPMVLVAGTNTINVSALAGGNDILVTVNLVTTQTEITDTITGTALDVGIVIPGATETLPEILGMSTMMLSSLVWIGITILICAATYKIRGQVGLGSGGGGKTVMIVFDICIIGGAVLGLLSILVAVLLFIGFGMLTGYILFYRGASF